MSDGGQVQKKKGKQESGQTTGEEVEAVDAAEAVDTSEIDDLLDEIDEVLEENAEEFVKNYVQKGGQ